MGARLHLPNRCSLSTIQTQVNYCGWSTCSMMSGPCRCKLVNGVKRRPKAGTKSSCWALAQAAVLRCRPYALPTDQRRSTTDYIPATGMPGKKDVWFMVDRLIWTLMFILPGQDSRRSRPCLEAAWIHPNQLSNPPLKIGFDVTGHTLRGKGIQASLHPSQAEQQLASLLAGLSWANSTWPLFINHVRAQAGSMSSGKRTKTLPEKKGQSTHVKMKTMHKCYQNAKPCVTLRQAYGDDVCKIRHAKQTNA